MSFPATDSIGVNFNPIQGTVIFFHFTDPLPIPLVSQLITGAISVENPIFDILWSKLLFKEKVKHWVYLKMLFDYCNILSKDKFV